MKLSKKTIVCQTSNVLDEPETVIRTSIPEIVWNTFLKVCCFIFCSHLTPFYVGFFLSRLHLHNLGLRDRGDLQDAGDMNEERLKYVDKFGFDVTTCCGYLPLDNTWNDDWPVSYQRVLEEVHLLYPCLVQQSPDWQISRLWKSRTVRFGRSFLELKGITRNQFSYVS